MHPARLGLIPVTLPFFPKGKEEKKKKPQYAPRF
jgi:hypothetical protein